MDLASRARCKCEIGRPADRPRGAKKGQIWLVRLIDCRPAHSSPRNLAQLGSARLVRDLIELDLITRVLWSRAQREETREERRERTQNKVAAADSSESTSAGLCRSADAAADTHFHFQLHSQSLSRWAHIIREPPPPLVSRFAGSQLADLFVAAATATTS